MARINRSADSVDTSDYEDGSKEKIIKTFAKQMLRTTLFVGTFQEKRWVESLSDYRDVIMIDSNEKKLIENLRSVERKILKTMPQKPWIGITNPNAAGAPAGYSVWVVLNENILGKYWFKIKSVTINSREFRLKLEIVRPFKEESPSSFSQTNISNTNSNSFDIQQSFYNICDNVKMQLIYFFKNDFTLSNIKDSIVFIVMLLVAILTGVVNLLKYLMEYILKLLRELSFFVKAVSPILITTINVTGKLIYGIFHSITSIFRSQPQYVYSNPQIPHRSSYPRLQMGDYKQRALPYKSSVLITEIDD